VQPISRDKRQKRDLDALDPAAPAPLIRVTKEGLIMLEKGLAGCAEKTEAFSLTAACRLASIHR
jgi:hypothetical protein